MLRCSFSLSSYAFTAIQQCDYKNYQNIKTEPLLWLSLSTRTIGGMTAVSVVIKIWWIVDSWNNVLMKSRSSIFGILLWSCLFEGPIQQCMRWVLKEFNAWIQRCWCAMRRKNQMNQYNFRNNWIAGFGDCSIVQSTLDRKAGLVKCLNKNSLRFIKVKFISRFETFMLLLFLFRIQWFDGVNCFYRMDMKY